MKKLISDAICFWPAFPALTKNVSNPSDAASKRAQHRLPLIVSGFKNGQIGVTKSPRNPPPLELQRLEIYCDSESSPVGKIREEKHREKPRYTNVTGIKHPRGKKARHESSFLKKLCDWWLTALTIFSQLPGTVEPLCPLNLQISHSSTSLSPHESASVINNSVTKMNHVQYIYPQHVEPAMWPKNKSQNKVYASYA